MAIETTKQTLGTKKKWFHRKKNQVKPNKQLQELTITRKLRKKHTNNKKNTHYKKKVQTTTTKKSNATK